MDTLRAHNIILQCDDIILRPMTENDWEHLYRWNNDPEVLFYSEGSDVAGYNLADVQSIYRGVSQHAFNFMVEYAGRVIGECWLQRMNMARIVERFPDLDCRRIDMAIGEKEYWGQGIGTRMIRLLTAFGFKVEKADAIFGIGVADYNPCSRRVFEKNGYVVILENAEAAGGKAKVTYDLMLSSERYERRKNNAGDGLCADRGEV